MSSWCTARADGSCWSGVIRRLQADGYDVTASPDQSVPFDDWLAASTRGAAFAGGQEHERGSLAPGKRADLVVLDRAGVGARILETWIGGTCRFRAEPA
jgi:predicted amidohydrolase YtcJ